METGRDGQTQARAGRQPSKTSPSEPRTSSYCHRTLVAQLSHREENLGPDPGKLGTGSSRSKSTRHRHPNLSTPLMTGRIRRPTRNRLALMCRSGPSNPLKMRWIGHLTRNRRVLLCRPDLSNPLRMGWIGRPTRNQLILQRRSWATPSYRRLRRHPSQDNAQGEVGSQELSFEEIMAICEEVAQNHPSPKSQQSLENGMDWSFDSQSTCPPAPVMDQAQLPIFAPLSSQERNELGLQEPRFEDFQKAASILSSVIQSAAKNVPDDWMFAPNSINDDILLYLTTKHTTYEIAKRLTAAAAGAYTISGSIISKRFQASLGRIAARNEGTTIEGLKLELAKLRLGNGISNGRRIGKPRPKRVYRGPALGPQRFSKDGHEVMHNTFTRWRPWE